MSYSSENPWTVVCQGSCLLESAKLGLEGDCKGEEEVKDFPFLPASGGLPILVSVTQAEVVPSDSN